MLFFVPFISVRVALDLDTIFRIKVAIIVASGGFWIVVKTSLLER